MGILERLRGKAHQLEASMANRSALAHDEAAEESSEVEKKREEAALAEQDHRQAEDMTAEGDPWD